jgi:hypothetical protein
MTILVTLTAFLSFNCYTGCSGGPDAVSDAISVAKFWKVRSTLKRVQYMKDRRLVKLLLYVNRSSKEDSLHIPNQLCVRPVHNYSPSIGGLYSQYQCLSMLGPSLKTSTKALIAARAAHLGQAGRVHIEQENGAHDSVLQLQITRLDCFLDQKHSFI